MEKKRYYWLRLKEEFFNLKMRELMATLTGNLALAVYLYLMLMTLNSEGVLRLPGDLGLRG